MEKTEVHEKAEVIEVSEDGTKPKEEAKDGFTAYWVFYT